MRQGDEGGMEEGTTGLRGVATSARGGHTCVAAGRWRVEHRPPRTPAESKCRKEAVADEGVAVAPRPPQEAVSYTVGGACPRRREVNELVLTELWSPTLRTRRREVTRNFSSADSAGALLRYSALSAQDKGMKSGWDRVQGGQ